MGGNPLSYSDPYGLEQKDLDHAISIVRKFHPEFFNANANVGFGSTPSNFGTTDFFTGDITVSDEFAYLLSDFQREQLLETLVHEYQHSNDSKWTRAQTNIEDMIEDITGIDIDSRHDEIFDNMLNGISVDAYDKLIELEYCK